MAPTETGGLRYFFDNYVLDTGRRELRYGPELIAIASQVFDLLDYLIRNRERVVSKDELIVAIWDGRIVSEAALTTRLNVARKAIGDSGKKQALIKTLPKRGIRFVGTVREENLSRNAPIAGSFSASRTTAVAPGRPSIAVLPFASFSDSSSDGSLGAGFTETVLIELSKLRWHIVSARNGIGQGKAVDNWQIARELGVRHVLEGSARQVGGRVRIAGRLLDAMTGAHVWAGRYDGSSTDILIGHDEIAQAMVSAIAPVIIRAEQLRALRSLPEQSDAYEAYQRGMWHMSLCEPLENKTARTFFERAINIDPHYAAGHCALAWSYMMSASIFSEMSIAEGCMVGEPLVRKAIALDENDVDARARLALTALLQGDLEGAFEEAQQVISVNRYCADALGVKGAALIYSGRQKEGRQAIQQYLMLSPNDPARPIRLSQIAASYYLDENYGRAVLTARQVIRQYPKHPIAYRWLAASLGQLGRAAEAEQTLQSLLIISPSSLDMYVRQRPQYCRIEHAPMLAGLRKAGWKD